MYISEYPEYEEETAMLIEEVLNQRILGLKNKVGAYITPAFPKLLYVTDENNIPKDSKYRYLTELAAKCVSKRMMPDFISAKHMKRNYEGNVFPCMGCVDGSEVITYKYKGELYVESFERMWNRFAAIFEVKHQFSEDNPNLYMDLQDVLIYDTKEGFVNVKRLIRNISSNWVKVKMSNGRLLTCTDDHPFHTERGRILARDLDIGDKVTISQFQYAESTKKPIDNELAWAYGVLLCDGCISSTVTATFDLKTEEDIATRLKEIIPQYYETQPVIRERRRGEKGNYYEVVFPSQKLQFDLIHKFSGIPKLNRHIPNFIFSSNEEVRLHFLSGMIDADGYVNSSGKLNYIQIGSTNKELALQQLALMQSLGMPAKVFENHYSKDTNKVRYRIECVPTNDLIGALRSEKKKSKFTNNVRTKPSISTEEVSEITSVEKLDCTMPSYDVTTDSDHFEVSGIYSHNCRAWLSPYNGDINNPDGTYKWYGRFNMGLTSINLADVGLSAKGDLEEFWKILDDRLNLCKESLMLRYEKLKNVNSDVSPIHWQHGALARLPEHAPIYPLLQDGYATISLGYIGVYECVMALLGVSHTTPEGAELALQIVRRLKKAVLDWKAETGLGFALYATPSESLTDKFAKTTRKRFGTIEGITDRNFLTNSYHVFVREPINAFDKLKFEAQFHPISSGGAISYVEVPNLANNVDAILNLVEFMYDHVQYAEMNMKLDYCQTCGFEGEILCDDDLVWYCPNCGNTDKSKMNVVRRTCGYLGENFWNEGRTEEIKDRVTHL